MTTEPETLAGGSPAARILPVDSARAASRYAGLARLSIPLVLASIVGVATIAHSIVALGLPSLWIVPDELIYAELSKSLAGGALPRIRDEVSFAYGLGYPAVLAPVWAVFDDMPTAYAVAKCVNALLLSLTAVPAYFLARRFVTRTPALVVGASSVAVPSMLYAGTLLTEVALYPAFVLALLAIAAAVERPTATTQTLALGAIALASSVKMLSAVLFVAYVAAIALFHWLDTRRAGEWRRRLVAYRPTWVAFVVVAAVGLGAAVASGRSPTDALGAYAVVLRNIDFTAVPWWFLLHVAELDLYLAVIPLVATVLVVCYGLSRDADQTVRLFSALVVPVVAGVVLVVAAYSSKAHAGAVGYFPSDARIHERGTFMLAPLLLIGLMLWLRDRRGSRGLVVVVVAMAVMLPALLPVGDLDGNVRFQALALVPWVEHVNPSAWPVMGLVFTSTFGLLFVLAARRRAASAVFVVPVVIVFGILTVFANASMRWASDWTRSAAWGTEPNWVDAAVGGRASVSVLWYEPANTVPVRLSERHRIVFVGEFFNRSIETVYELGSPLPYDLPSTPVKLREGRVVLEDGTPARLGKFVLVPCYVRVTGTPVARDPSTGAVVMRVRQPARAVVASPESCPEAGTT